jgi:hypothetical protein
MTVRDAVQAVPAQAESVGKIALSVNMFIMSHSPWSGGRFVGGHLMLDLFQ